MTDRYGNTRVAKIKAAYNDLRAAIRAGDIEAAERAMDRYEPWADYVFGVKAPDAPKVKPRVKPLEWKPHPGDVHALEVWSSPCVGGRYCIEHRRHESVFDLWHPEEAVGTRYPTLETAKAAAQADYERRILSTLEGYDD